MTEPCWLLNKKVAGLFRRDLHPAPSTPLSNFCVFCDFCGYNPPMLTVLLSSILLVAQIAYSPAWDGPAADFPELEPARKDPVPLAENAYLILREATVVQGSENLSSLRDLDLEDTSPEKLDRWEEALAAAAEVEPALRAFLDAQTYYETEAVPTETHHLQFILGVIRYLQVRTLHAIHTDRPEDAMRSAAQALDISYRMMSHNRSLIQWMMSTLTMIRSLESAHHVLLAFPNADPAALLEALKKTPDMRRTAWRAFQGEFRFIQNKVSEMKEEGTHYRDVVFAANLPSGFWDSFPVASVLLQENNTTTLYGNTFMPWHPFLHAKMKERSEIPWPGDHPSQPARSNLLGERLVESFRPSLHETVHTALKTEAHARALIRLIDLREQASLSPSLYADPFTGLSMRLSDDQTRILSAGKDQTFGTEDDLEFSTQSSRD